MMMTNPHAQQPVLRAGQPIETARAVVIMAHGRGSDAQDMMGLAGAIGIRDVAYIAPQAASNTWYPQRFLVPRQANQPWLKGALERLDELVAQVVAGGIDRDRIVLLGFSQGACLVSDYAARNTARYGGVAVLSGGLIGADDELMGYEGDLAGTPVFMGVSDVDFHIPLERVEASASVLAQLGADVDKRIYPGMGHTINEDELAAVQAMIQAID